jgi:hypothetical protein
LTSGYKNVTVLNPGIEVPSEDETGPQLWGPDPMHPLPGGYARIADLLMNEWDSIGEKKRKRSPDGQEPASKRPKYARLPAPGGLIRASRGQPYSLATAAGEGKVEAEAEASDPGGVQGGAGSRMCTTKSR